MTPRDHTNSEDDLRNFVSRRALLARGGAVLGACLTTSTLPHSSAQQQPPGGGAFDVRNFGATGMRKDNATAAFRAAVEACASHGGGVVNVPPGEYTVGTVRLKDHITLNIEAGATLFLSQDKNDFEKGERCMILAENATNIALTGRGTLDGLAQYEFTEMHGVDPEIATEIEIARAAGIDMRRYYRSRQAMNTFMLIVNDCIDFVLTGVSSS
ncbi:MAG TPA: hypothetical protein VFI14_12330, partial [Chryseosolibacter sp.]|nr:hypothetical protein [Chryseosolibacter sp.]